MKLIIQTIYVAILAIIIGGCTKDNGETPEDSPLIITVTPDPGTSFARTLGATYEFQVGLTSRMPANGVDVMVTFRQDYDNAIVFSRTYSTTTMPLSVLVTDIPFNEMGTVSVNVVSKTRSTNSASKSFRLVRK